jgi:hypothetical protein
MTLADFLILVLLAAAGYGVVALVFNIARRRRPPPPTDVAEPAPPRTDGNRTRICPRRGCELANPPSARFCQWCGQPLTP